MKVPLLDLRKQNAPLRAELRAVFERVLDSGHYILGPELEAFEQRAAAYTGTRYALGVSSGTDALLLALMSLSIGPGDEVICPSFTFFATAGSIARTGAQPIFADCCPVCFNLDVEDARRRVTPRTKAVIAVHLFGQCADMDAVMRLAREHGLAVIEDAAQALGASHGGRKAGSMGDFGAFSFYPSKNLGGFGDAGLLVTSSDELAARARLLRTHGARQKYVHEWVGGNFRMDALQAALLAVKLNHLDAYNERRRRNAQFYIERLSELEGVALSGSAASQHARILLPAVCPSNLPIWNQFTIQVTNGSRDALRAHLEACGIATEIYYPYPLHLQPCFQHAGQPPPVLAVCERLAKQCLSLPVHSELTQEQLDAVVSAFARFLKS